MGDHIQDITTDITKLSLKTHKTAQSKARSNKVKDVVDDWELEADTSDDNEVHPDTDRPQRLTTEEDELSGTDSTSPIAISDQPIARSSPSSISGQPSHTATERQLRRDDGPDTESPQIWSKPRPEKTDAVARRMIASALGMKMPKRTDAQREYDQAVTNKERRRRTEAREAQKKRDAEAEKARQAIWED
jgi:hypothetical protein